ncbi:hypothetical protein CI089_05435 [Microbacterium sp. Yaish 1]|nr:hypothetical protein CI089_05435 [Microbacterium sp. Yaish 1]
MLTDPAALVWTARYRHPFISAVVASTRSVVPVALTMSDQVAPPSADTCHWVRTPSPEAEVVNSASLPTSTMTSTGCSSTIGRSSTVTVKAPAANGSPSGDSIRIAPPCRTAPGGASSDRRIRMKMPSGIETLEETDRAVRPSS